MAVGLAITSEGGQYYNGKVTPFVVLSCIVAATGGLIFGYDIGISGSFSCSYLLYNIIHLALMGLNPPIIFNLLHPLQPINDLGLGWLAECHIKSVETYNYNQLN